MQTKYIHIATTSANPRGCTHTHTHTHTHTSLKHPFFLFFFLFKAIGNFTGFMICFLIYQRYLQDVQIPYTKLLSKMKYSEFERLLGIMPMLFIIISKTACPVLLSGKCIKIISMNANRYYLIYNGNLFPSGRHSFNHIFPNNFLKS